MPIEALIQDDGIVRIIKHEKCGSTVKNVKLGEFARALLDDESRYVSPILPKNVFQYAVSGDSVTLALDFTGKKVTFSHVDYPALEIPVPDSVWFIRLIKNSENDKYSLVKAYPFVYDMILKPNSEIYIWPFPNYSLSYTPGICWGHLNSFKAAQRNFTLADMENLFAMYFSGTANNDLGWNMSSISPVSIREKLTQLSQLEAFPFSWLTTHPGYSTYQDAFESLLERGTL